MKYGEKQMIGQLGMLLWDLAGVITNDNPKYRQEKLATMRRRTVFMEECMDATEEQENGSDENT